VGLGWAERMKNFTTKGHEGTQRRDEIVYGAAFKTAAIAEMYV
jgi:hypothetical protein